MLCRRLLWGRIGPWWLSLLGGIIRELNLLVPKGAAACSRSGEVAGKEGAVHKYRSLGAPPRLTFQARLLHNEEGGQRRKGGFERFRRELSLDV